MMKKTKTGRRYFIDSENVHSLWLNLQMIIAEEDQIMVFYTDNSPNMKYEHIMDLMKLGEDRIRFIKCYQGHNALDFQLVTELGASIAREPECEYVIVTNDTGFDAVVKYWLREGMNISRLKGAECQKLAQRQEKAVATEQRKQSRETASTGRTGHDEKAGAGDKAQSSRGGLFGWLGLGGRKKENTSTEENAAVVKSEAGVAAQESAAGQERTSAKKKNAPKKEAVSKKEKVSAKENVSKKEKASKKENVSGKEKASRKETEPKREKPVKQKTVPQKEGASKGEISFGKEKASRKEAEPKKEKRVPAMKEQDFLRALGQSLSADDMQIYYDAFVAFYGQEKGGRQYKQFKKDANIQRLLKEQYLSDQQQRMRNYLRLMYRQEGMMDVDIVGVMQTCQQNEKQDLQELYQTFQKKFGTKLGADYYRVIKKHSSVLKKFQ